MLATHLLDRGGMLVGLSGGPDSTALLFSLLEAGIPVMAAHFDHALRDGSARDAAWLADRCDEWGVKLVTSRRRRPLSPGSLQAAARAARYEFFEEVLASTGMPSLALGHTADDLVEGTVMHLLRGTGLAGMRGMPERRGRFVRPMLHVWREEVESYLRQAGVEPLRDPSNLDRRHQRVRVRLDLLPALETARPGLKRRLHGAARRAAELQLELETAASRLMTIPGRLALSSLRSSSAVIRAEALRIAYRDFAGGGPALSRSHVAAMVGLVLGGRSGQTLDLPGMVRIHRGYGYVEMIRMPIPPQRRISAELMLATCAGCGADDAVHFPIGTRVTIGRRRPGLRMRPLPGRRLRKLQDILVDAKVPREARDELPLVFADGELAWVPGIAIDARCAGSQGRPSMHVEMLSSRDALLESFTPTQGVLS